MPRTEFENIPLPPIAGKNKRAFFKHCSQFGTTIYQNGKKDHRTNSPKTYKLGFTRWLDEMADPVECHSDDCLLFDVETLLKHNSIPIIAIAVSNNEWFDSFTIF